MQSNQKRALVEFLKRIQNQIFCDIFSLVALLIFCDIFDCLLSGLRHTGAFIRRQKG